MRTFCGAVVIVFSCVMGTYAQATQDEPPDRTGTRVDSNPRPSIRIGDVARVDFRVKLQLDFRSFSPEQPKHDETLSGSTAAAQRLKARSSDESIFRSNGSCGKTDPGATCMPTLA